MKAVRLDVTSSADIDAAVALIRREGRGLYAIVSNAGVGYSKRFDETTTDDIDFVSGLLRFARDR